MPKVRVFLVALVVTALLFCAAPKRAAADIVTTTYGPVSVSATTSLPPLKLSGQSSCALVLSGGGSATITPYGSSDNGATYQIVTAIGAQSSNGTYGGPIVPYLTNYYVAASGVSGTVNVTESCSAAYQGGSSGGGGGGGASTVVEAGTSGNVVVTEPTTSPPTYSVDLNPTLLWVGASPAPTTTPAGYGSLWISAGAAAPSFGEYIIERTDQGSSDGLNFCGGNFYGSACTNSNASLILQNAGDVFINPYAANQTSLGEIGQSSSAGTVVMGGYHVDASSMLAVDASNNILSMARLTSNSGKIGCPLSAGACTTSAIAPGNAASKCTAVLDKDDSTASLAAANVTYSVTNEEFTFNAVGATGTVEAYYLCP